MGIQYFIHAALGDLSSGMPLDLLDKEKAGALFRCYNIGRVVTVISAFVFLCAFEVLG